ncbi:MAG: hypothetical protein EB147_04280, partial [Acidimicrobiia bacterium]|nr:hypothetical protein [Acidimicrobiia bacterium]
PVLTPLAVDPAHPFPYVSNLAFSIAAMIRDDATGEERFARVKVPTLFPRLYEIPGTAKFVPVEEIIVAQMTTLFPGMTVSRATTFRITRNADLTLEDEDADDLLQAVEMELRRRRFGRAVRLELDARADAEMRHLLMEEHDLTDRDVIEVEGLIDLTCLMQIHSIDRAELKDDPWQPVTAGRLAAAEESDRSIFAVQPQCRVQTIAGGPGPPSASPPRFDRQRGRPRRSGSRHDQGELAGRSRDDRASVRRVTGRNSGGLGGARHLLPAGRGARTQREHQGAIGAGSVLGALAHLPIRQWPRNGATVASHRLGRLDGSQPRSSGGGADSVGSPSPSGLAGPHPAGDAGRGIASLRNGVRWRLGARGAGQFRTPPPAAALRVGLGSADPPHSSAHRFVNFARTVFGHLFRSPGALKGFGIGLVVHLTMWVSGRNSKFILKVDVARDCCAGILIDFIRRKRCSRHLGFMTRGARHWSIRMRGR